MTLMERRRALLAAQGGGFEHGTWEDLFYHIDKGDYATAYQQGEAISLDLGPTLGTINMEISNFDADVLASDVSKTAPVSFVAKELLNPSHRWNPAIVGSSAPYTEGTGTIGGWEKSELRAWLRFDVWGAIPALVRNRIATVSKCSTTFGTDGVATYDYETEETVFIPSYRECGRSNQWTETKRYTTYSAISSNEKRKKAKAGEGATNWWLRSCYSLTQAGKISGTGRNDSGITNNVQNSLGILLCFCIG